MGLKVITIILMSLHSINLKKDVVSYVSVSRPSSVNCTTKALGLNFALSPKKIPVAQIIAATETTVN